VSQRTGILFLNSPERPGADTWVQNLIIRHLDRARFDVHVACSPGSPSKPSQSLEVLRAIPEVHLRATNFGPSLSGSTRREKVFALAQGGPMLASLAGLVAYIRRRGIRVIHSSDRPRDAIACVLLAKASGAKSVIHVHVKCDAWMGAAVRWAMRSADALIAISEHVARSFSAFGIQPQRSHVVLNAIEPEAWDPGLDGASVRKELHIPAEAPVVICVARLFHWKGQAELIEAFARVRSELPLSRLLIVGEEDKLAGADRPNFLAELQALTERHGLGGNVIFTGRRPDVARLMAASDVFAMPSFEEPFGLVYTEAMSMKRPVVALDNGGTPEVVDHGKSGLLCAPGDIAALASNIVTLLRDPALRSRMGEFGRQQVEARFRPRRMADDIGRVYATLTGSVSGTNVRGAKD
jgi:glycosyltransferase involved in cell wall biosynthesis